MEYEQWMGKGYPMMGLCDGNTVPSTVQDQSFDMDGVLKEIFLEHNFAIFF